MTVQMQKAIQYLKEQKREYGTPSIFADYCDLAIECIEKQSKTDWIPCEERLPSENGWYLVTNTLGVVQQQYWGANHWNKLRDESVIAWTFLPQPYKKEGAENE